MMKTELIQRQVYLEPQDYRLVKKVAQERGFGGKGFSAAIRFILREWAVMDEARSGTNGNNKGESA